jgi:ABC-type Mn2+/Zn2+ transport system ATPase subunit
VAPVIVLAGALFWTGAGTGLRPGEIYTILAVVAIVSRPLATLLVAIPAITSAMASFPRIQKFLCQDEQVDNRSDADDNHTSIKAAGVTVDSELARHIFQGVNLQIMQGAVVMLTGPVGCGKTTLLKSLIGEVQLQSGSVQVAQSCPIGYSDQVAWLENITIKKNICHEDYNAVWYKEVLAACALETDLADLSAGDETVVGANSSNLSGGQKQRIVRIVVFVHLSLDDANQNSGQALARAVYCQAPLLVLDDPLSAVDVTTSSIIAERLFGENGLLRKRNATVLMTTNSGKFYFGATAVGTFKGLLGTLLGDLCSVADLVFTMDMEGNIGRLENLSRGTKSQADVHEDSKTQQEDGLDEKAGASSGTAAASSPARIAAADITNEIQKGDITLYAYYIGSIRRSLVVLSLGFIALSSILDRLPGEYIPRQ